DIQELLQNTTVISLHSIKIATDGEKIAVIATTAKEGTRALFLYYIANKKLKFIENNIDQAEFLNSNQSLYFIQQVNLAPKNLLIFENDKSKIIYKASKQEILALIYNKETDMVFLKVNNTENNSLYIVKGLNLSLITRNFSNRIGQVVATNSKEILLVEDYQNLERICSYTLSNLKRNNCWKYVFLNESVEDFFKFKDDVFLITRLGSNYELKSFTQSGDQKNVFNFGNLKIKKTYLDSDQHKELEFKIYRYLKPIESFNLNASTFKTPEPEKEIEEINCSLVSNYKVPATFISNKKAKNSILLLEVYGAYGETLSPEYSPEYEFLSKNGVDIGVVHVRGSAYFGKKWHDAGRQENKVNSIKDLAICAKYFKAKNSAYKIIVSGKSAGGFIAAATAIKHPELINALVLDAPFLNPLETLSDKSNELLWQDIYEWGNPNNQKVKLAMNQISPEVNASQAKINHLLLFARIDDRLVSIKSILNWLNAIKNTQKQDINLVLSSEGGHLGPASPEDLLRQKVLKIAFIMRQH
ncbi:MAG: alpha/beta fold hydrolase, partial [Bdellovibrionales bacterium]|nr:alpha/beta fold hydrolase [Bdellovibrionales bacterium]